MFFITAKSLQKEEIVPTIEQMQNNSGRVRQRAYMDLRETFNNLVRSEIGTVIQLAHDEKERRDIVAVVESKFFEILMNENTKNFDPAQVITNVSSVLKQRVNKEKVKEWLGITEQSDLSNYQRKMNEANKRFHERYHRAPVWKDEADIELFAEVFGSRPETIHKILSIMNNSQIQSLNSNVSGDGNAKNVQELIDTIKSENPIPDEVMQDNELRSVFKNIIETKLTPDERKVMMLYFDPYGDKGLRNRKITVKEVSDESGLSERQVHYLLDKMKAKIVGDRQLHELYAKRVDVGMVKYAIRIYHELHFNAIKVAQQILG